MSDTPLKKLLKLADKTGILRARDAEQNGIARTYPATGGRARTADASGARFQRRLVVEIAQFQRGQ